MIQKRLDQIQKNDIEDLIVNAVAEGKTIEYKLLLPGNSDEDKKELLADISSFANAGGGDLIFGIADKKNEQGQNTGMPEKAIGLANFSPEQDRLRIDNIIRDGTQPRIQGIQYQAVDGFEKGPVLVIRIPKSWNAPHMVTFKNLSRFYSRTSAGKYQLDITEIRSAFLMSESATNRIRGFRDDRIAKIMADDTPIKLCPKSRMALHLLPVSAMTSLQQIDVRMGKKIVTELKPVGCSGWNYRYNYDGFLTYTRQDSDGSCDAYLQLFRNGAIESVTTSIVEENLISSIWYEKNIIESVREYLKAESALEISFPFLCFVTLTGVKGCLLGISHNQYFGDETHPIDQDILMLPDVLIENADVPIDKIFRPIFDIVWQAAGHNSCKNYNQNGVWVGF